MIEEAGGETIFQVRDKLAHRRHGARSRHGQAGMLDEEVFIIGGASVYQETMNIANKLYITYIENTPKQADAYFPPIDKHIWKETSRETHSTDEKHLYPYIFIDYERIR